MLLREDLSAWDKFKMGGYTVKNIGDRTTMRIIESQKLSEYLSAEFDNLADVEYYNHLSRVKSVMPEPGRNIKLLYKVYF